MSDFRKPHIYKKKYKNSLFWVVIDCPIPFRIRPRKMRLLWAEAYDFVSYLNQKEKSI